MTHTIDTLMALAFSYAYKYAKSCDVEQDSIGLRSSREALRAALTEAIAPQPEWNDENVIAWCVARGIKAAQPVREPCCFCNGTGQIVRDPDIGTDQECFACDGSGIGGDK